eukprot:11250793-Prorocentrum_lima.AAC.1
MHRAIQYHKMLQSWRDEYAYNEPATLQEQEGDIPPSMLKYRRICTACELEARKERLAQVHQEREE